MQLISSTTCYAFLAMGCIDAGHGRWVQAKAIVDCTGIPLPTLKKVLHILSRSGLIHTRRGFEGGCRLARPADEIHLPEIVEAIEGKNWGHSCFFELPEPKAILPRRIYQFLQDKISDVTRELQSVSLGEMEAFSESYDKRYVKVYEI